MLKKGVHKLAELRTMLAEYDAGTMTENEVETSITHSILSELVDRIEAGDGLYGIAMMGMAGDGAERSIVRVEIVRGPLSCIAYEIDERGERVRKKRTFFDAAQLYSKDGEVSAGRDVPVPPPLGFTRANVERARGFDPDERAREKQVSRDQDAADLAAGRVTPEELRARNGAFNFPRERLKIELRGVKSPK